MSKDRQNSIIMPLKAATINIFILTVHHMAMCVVKGLIFNDGTTEKKQSAVLEHLSAHCVGFSGVKL